MISALVLKLLVFSKPFVLVVNVSAGGIGVVLSKENHKIAYFSRKLTPCMQKQTTYVREFVVVTETVRKFHHYLVGHQFIIKPDQAALKHLFQQNIQNPEHQRWLPKLLKYDFIVEYKLGRDNIPIDVLYRCHLMVFLSVHCILLSQL